MPKHARKSFFAIRAFNVEVASIKDGSERRRMAASLSGETGSSLALRMRMQWWRDALSELYPQEDHQQFEPSVPGFLSSTSTSCWRNPVVRALHDSIEESNLTRRFLERLLDAREADLEIQQLATMEDATQYAEDTYASLLYLALETCNVRDDAADDVATHAGIGLGLVIALRSTAHRAALGEMAIPAEAFSSPVPSSYLLRRSDSSFAPVIEHDEIVKEAVQHMAYEASTHLLRARELQEDVPKTAKACLLPVVPAMHYLSLLKQADFDLWDPKLAADNEASSRFTVMARLGRSWLTGTI